MGLRSRSWQGVLRELCEAPLYNVSGHTAMYGPLQEVAVFHSGTFVRSCGAAASETCQKDGVQTKSADIAGVCARIIEPTPAILSQSDYVIRDMTEASEVGDLPPHV